MVRDQHLIFVTEVVSTPEGHELSGVLLDPSPAIDFSEAEWTARLSGTDIGTLRVAVATTTSLVTPAKPPGESHESFALRRAHESRRRLVLQGAQNAVFFACERQSALPDVPFFFSSQPCDFPWQASADVEMLIDAFAETPDFLAYADRLLEYCTPRSSKPGSSSVEPQKRTLYDDVVLEAEALSVLPRNAAAS